MSTPAATGKTNDQVEVLIGIGEGPIEGLEDGLKSFYFGDTPVMSQSGQMQFENCTIDLRLGEDNPDPLRLELGGSALSHTVGVALYENTPVIRSTTGGQIDFLDVRILAVNVGKNDGGEWGVDFDLEYKRSSSGTWLPWRDGTTDPKMTISGSLQNQIFEYRRHVNRLPPGETYDIRVTKTTYESTSKRYTSINWESFQEIDAKDRSYPNVAMVRVYAKSSNQFTSVPQFWGVYKGYKCRVPVNFDPLTRTYDGIWDGTFKVAWTDDPAWILYECVMNSRWGMNAYYPCTIDKYDCYEASQWTSHQVPNGEGGTQPRYTFNRWIREPLNGMELINIIAGSFGGRCFDDQNGTIILRLDIDSQPVALFTPENVENGLFNYSYTDLDQRYNDATVTFPNPNMTWQLDRRYISIQDSIDEIGKIHLDYQLDDCTNVHEALRRGYLRVISSVTETEQVSFNTNRLGCTVSPFEIFLVSDPDMGYGLSGRVKSISPDRKTIYLRDALPLEANVLYTFLFQTPNGVISVDYGTLASTSVTQITWPSALDAGIEAGTTFNLGSEFGWPTGPTPSTIGLPKPYRCVKIDEVEGNPDKVQIVGIEVNRNKWAAADNAEFVEDSEYSYRRPGTDVKPPQIPLSFNYSTRTLNGQTVPTLEIRWNKSPDMFLSRYRIEYDYEGTGSQLLTETTNTNVNFDNPKPGTYTFHVYALNTASNPSPALSGSTTVSAATAALPPSPITGLEIAGQGNNTIFTTRDVKFAWRLRSTGQNLDFDDEDALSGAESGAMDSTFQNFIVQFFDGATGKFFFQDTTTDPFYTLAFDSNYNTPGGPHRNIIIKVFYRDIYGQVSSPATLAVNNPIPLQVQNVTGANGQGSITILWPKGIEPDLKGYKLFTTYDDGVHGPVTSLAYDGPQNSYVFTGVPGKNYQARVGAYDNFDETYVLSEPYLFTVPYVDGAALDQQTQAEIDEALRLGLQGRDILLASGVDWAQTFQDLSASVLQLLTNAEITNQTIREAGVEIDPTTGAVTIYSVKNLTGVVTGHASAISQISTVVSGDAKITTAPTPPADPAIGDLWVDSSTPANLVYRWNGVSWVYFGPIAGTIYAQSQSIIALESLVNDPITGLVAVSSGLQNLSTTVTIMNDTVTAQGIALTALQATVNDPVTGMVAIASAVSSLTVTVQSQGDTIDAHAISITALETTVNDPVTGVAANATAISTLTTAVTNKSKTFVQNTTPTATAVGDLWVHTGAGNTILSWDGSNWVGREDLNKATTFAQSSTPTAKAVGDIWINTSGGANTMSRWNGSSWVAVDNPVIAATASSLTSLTATVGNFSASGYFRVYVAATASGANSTIGISSSATSGSGTYNAGLFIDTHTSGWSRVRIIADQFYLTPSSGSVGGSPFYVSGGNVYMNNAYIINLDASTITTGTLYAGAIQAGSITTTKIAIAAVDSDRIAANSTSNGAFIQGSSVTLSAASTWYDAASTSITTIGGRIVVNFSTFFSRSTGAPSPALYGRVVVTGGTQVGYMEAGDGTTPRLISMAGFGYYAPSAGTYTFTFQVQRIGGDNSCVANQPTLILTEFRK